LDWIAIVFLIDFLSTLSDLVDHHLIELMSTLALCSCASHPLPLLLLLLRHLPPFIT
jgi:hypothetical protein